MAPSSWLRALARRWQKPARRRPVRRQGTGRLLLEPLEDRTLPSAVAWQPLGPAPISTGGTTANLPVSGRVSAIAVDPSSPSTIYLGAASGGVWKSTDGGQTWTPETDFLGINTGNPVTMSIGAIAIAPSNPQVVYVGTGEANFSSDEIAGQGVLKSVDGGAHWTLISGSQFAGEDISAIVVDPRNPDHLFLAGAEPLGGIWESTTGGATWTSLKLANPNVNNNQPFDSRVATITALVMDPNNPDTLFAAAGWLYGNGYNGVYRRTIDASDDGSVFAFAGNFLNPQGGSASTSGQIGRISLAISPSNPDYLYAMVASPSTQNVYEVLKTTNGQASDVTTINWQALPDANRDTAPDRMLHGQGWYDNIITVDPTDPNTVYAAGYKVWYSNDGGQSSDGSTSWYELSNEGGETLPSGDPAPVLHNDQHAFAWIPGTHTLLVGTDGGIFQLNGITNNPNQSAPPTQSKLGLWASANGNLQITQFYDVAVSLRGQGIALGAAQDNGISDLIAGRWGTAAFGDALQVAIAPSGFGYGLDGSSPNFSGGQFLVQVNPPSTHTIQYGSTGSGPFAIDPTYLRAGYQDRIEDAVVTHDAAGNTSHLIYESGNSGGSWTQISGPGSGWLFDSSGASNVFVNAITVSPTVGSTGFPTIVVNGAQSGTNRVLTAVTADDGKTWVLFAGPGSAGTEDLEFDPSDSNSLYAVAGGHLYHGTITRDSAGQVANLVWTDITGSGLPAGTSIHSIAIDDRYGGQTLYAGTDYGVFARDTANGSWFRYAAGLPNVKVTRVIVAPGLNTLAAGTYGRGLWEVQAGVTATLANGTLTVQGDGNDDNITLRLDPNDSSQLQVLVAAPGSSGPAVVAEFPVANISQIDVNGGGGNETLTVDDSYGVVSPNIAYDGGTGKSRLDTVGGQFNTEEDDFTSPRAGTLRFNGDQGPVITYSNVTALDDLAAVTDYHAKDLLTGAGSIGIGDGISTPGEAATEISVGPPFRIHPADVFVANKGALTVHGPTTPIHFDVLYSAPVNLTLDGQGGQDTFSIYYTTTQHTITVGESGAAQQSTLNLNDQQNQNDPGTTVYAISATRIERTGSVTVSGGPGGLNFGATDDVTVAYSNVGFVNVYGGATGNTFNVQDTNAGAATTLNAGTGGDTANIYGNTGGLAVQNFATVNIGRNGSVQNVTGGITATNDAAVTVDDSADPNVQTMTVTPTTVTGFPGTSSAPWLAYSGLNSLTIRGGTPSANGVPTGAGNTFNVQGTAPLPGGTMLYAGTGPDAFNVGSTANTLDAISGLTVNGAGKATLTIHDEGTTTRQEWDVSNTGFDRYPAGGSPPAVPQITYHGMAKLTANTGTDGGVIGVGSTAAGTTTSVQGNAGGADEFIVENAANMLDDLQGPLQVHDVAASNLFLIDEGNTAGHTYTLTTGQVARDGIQPITYDHMAEMVLGTPDRPTVPHGPSTINVQSLGGGVFAIVTVGTGATVNVGQNHSMAGILGDLRIQGLAGQPPQQVTLDDSTDTTAPATRTITLGSDPTFGYLVSGLANTSQGRGRIGLQLDPAAPVSILGSPSQVLFQVNDLTGAPALSLVGSAQGTTTLQGPNTANTWQVTGANAGSLDGTVAFSGVQNLTGGTAGDTFKFQTGGSLAGKIDGGGGTNTLDYSAYKGDILVDLLLHTASLVGQGVSNIANVTGSQGNDLIVGDANANVLVGGTGRNVLIGDGGSDTITGGGGFNLLIGGITSYDNQLTALQDLMQYWDNPNATTLDQLVKGLKKGVTVNGRFLVLGKSTVQNDDAPDSLLGGGAPNWFIADKDDTINNGNGPGPNDRLTRI